MRKRRRVEVTIETARVLVMRRGHRTVMAWCDGCGEQVRMVTVEEAAAVAGMNARAIYGRVEAAEVHFRETSEGGLLVCLNSLLK